MMNKHVWSISQLLSYIKDKLTSDYLLNNVQVEGEIGNFKPNYSGHWYFSLKDTNGLIDCAMFRGNNMKVKFSPKDGDKVIVTGNVSIYEKSGRMQLLITSMEISGAGNFYVQFELMKKKLGPLGYFDLNRKKRIPKYPDSIAVVTGANTAALKDIQITIGNRWPLAKIMVCPATVQGAEAPSSIVKALKQADSLNADVVILARGGGSVDDLWCFNDEGIANTIFMMNTPIVTGIGHEIDTTIADLVADERCATPTAAAQRVTPNINDVLGQIDNYIQIMQNTTTSRLQQNQQTLDYYNSVLQSLDSRVKGFKIQLNMLANLLNNEMNKKQILVNKRYNVNLINFKDSANKMTRIINDRHNNSTKNLFEAMNNYIYESKLYLSNTNNNLNHCPSAILNRIAEQNNVIANHNHANRITALNKLKMAQNKHQYADIRLKSNSKMVMNYIENNKAFIESLAHSQQISISNRLNISKNQYLHSCALLDSVSPLKILSRGYSITTQNATIIKSVKTLDLNTDISIKMSDGTLLAKPLQIKEGKNGK